MRNRALNKCIMFVLVFFSIIITIFVLKDKNDITSLFLIFVTIILFFISFFHFRIKFDCLIIFSIPLLLTISKTIWIAHPLIETSGYLSVGSGFYFKYIDIAIIYLLWRTPLFDKDRNNILIYAYILITLFSSIYAINTEAAIAEAVVYIKCFIVYKSFSKLKSRDKYLHYFLNGLEIAMIFQGIIAIFQYITGGTIGLLFLGENNDALRYRIVNGVIERGSAGTFDHSGQLAVFSVFFLLFIVFCEKKKKKRLCLSLLGAIVLYLASSRTAMLVLVIALTVGIIGKGLRYVKKNTIIIFLTGLGSMLLIIPYMLKNKLFDFILNSDLFFQIGNRFAQWELAFSYIKKSVLLGYGANNYSTKMMTINSTDFYYMNPVHNNYILHWFEVGLLGFIVYIAINVRYLLKLRKFKSMDNFAKAALLFIVCVVIYNFTGWTFATPNCIYLLWISMGIIDGWTEKDEVAS